MDEAFRKGVGAAAGRQEIILAVRDLYARVQAQIDLRRPICELSGRCCRFEEYGHRLFVTTLEMAVFLQDLEASRRAAGGPWDGTGCPFQEGKVCTVHSFRPFGCRMFFCDPTAEDWQREHHERFLTEIKGLHDQLGVPYHYLEWRRALAAMGLSQSPHPEVP